MAQGTRKLASWCIAVDGLLAPKQVCVTGRGKHGGVRVAITLEHALNPEVGHADATARLVGVAINEVESQEEATIVENRRSRDNFAAAREGLADGHDQEGELEAPATHEQEAAAAVQDVPKPRAVREEIEGEVACVHLRC
ncbi:hypothetical protein SEVIR_3G384150v4 [Setaria viridis]